MSFFAELVARVLLILVDHEQAKTLIDRDLAKRVNEAVEELENKKFRD